MTHLMGISVIVRELKTDTLFLPDAAARTDTVNHAQCQVHSYEPGCAVVVHTQ